MRKISHLFEFHLGAILPIILKSTLTASERSLQKEIKMIRKSQGTNTYQKARKKNKKKPSNVLHI